MRKENLKLRLNLELKPCESRALFYRPFRCLFSNNSNASRFVGLLI